MAKTIETYIRLSEPTALGGDKQFFVGDERSGTANALYVPTLSFEQIEQTTDALTPILGETADQVFAVKESADFKLATAETEVVLATGICPFPMDYNAALNPPAGPGSARWYDKETGAWFALPSDFSDALDLIIDNPPAISIANLMKAGGIGIAKTVLIEEVEFYVGWILSKLTANSDTALTESQQQAAKERLSMFVRKQYDRNTRCFEAMRRITQNTVVLKPVVRVEDTDDTYAGEVTEQVSRWRNDMPGGKLLDVAGLRVAAYYSSALTKAYRGIGIVSASETCVIAEGVANLIIPDNSPFNTARRRAFRELAKTDSSPGVLAYPSPALTASVRKQRLEAEPISASPSSVAPDVTAFYKYPKKPAKEAWSQPAFQWSLAMPGTPRLRDLQMAAITGDPSATRELSSEMNRTIEAILNEA